MQLEAPNLLLTHGWIGGAEVTSNQEFAVINPATFETVATVSDLGASHCEDAINAASEALKKWRTVSSSERVARVSAWADLIEENADDLSAILIAENGKPSAEAKGEILQCAALLRWYIDALNRQEAQPPPDSGNSQNTFTLKQPIGVVACITPWNFPAASVIVKAGAALLAGCTTVVKPSDETPLIALALAQLSAQADIPPGAFNVVPCKDPRPVGDALCSSPKVRMLSFTGSTAVGKQLYAACGDTIKKIALELGGNAPFIVFDDADLDSAVESAVGARFYNGGQICVGANRLFIHKKVYAEFSKRLADAVATLEIGPGSDPSTRVGPMINQKTIERLGHLVSNATKMGAEVLTGGNTIGEQTHYFEPTVISGMTAEMDAYRTEIFGPVACLYSFDDEEEVLRQANETQAGLSAYVFTRDADRLDRFIEALEAGIVGANSTQIFSNDMPFGGIKQSGIGREHGMEGLNEFFETKSVFSNRPG